MIDKNFDPWKRVREFNPESLLQESSDLVQWPIKLYKAPKLSPYYHHDICSLRRTVLRFPIRASMTPCPRAVFR